MAVVLKCFKTIRNNWKKTVFFSAVAAYGSHYGKGIYDDILLRRAFCLEAQVCAPYKTIMYTAAGSDTDKKIGNAPLPMGQRARKITVFLNPAAKGGGSRKVFDKNVAPILYLSGAQVTVIKTEYEGQAKKYMDVMEDSDAIVVAGGDGTLAEVVTGIMRREDAEKFSSVPIGFIPLGMTNTLSRVLFDEDQSEVARLLQATWAVITCCTKPLDVMQITGEENKKVYALSSIQWGPFREAELRKPRYKLFRSLKHRIAHMTHVIGGEWPASVHASLSYSYPCGGCSTCWSSPSIPVWKWWHVFLPPRVEVPKVDYSQVTNAECGHVYSQEIDAMELEVTTQNNTQDSEKQHGLNLLIGPGTMTKGEFVREGSHRHIDGRSPDFGERISVGKVKLIPESRKGTDPMYSIDNELFELMPIEVELLKNKIRVFVPDRTITAPSPATL